MSNVIKISVLLFTMVIASCSGDNKRSQIADELIGQAKECVTAKDYSTAIELLDTLDISYRDCVEQRREGARLRVETLIALVQDSIAADEARRPALQNAVDSLRPLFQKVEMPGTDGFYVLKSLFSGRDLNVTAIQPRIDDKGYFFVVANVSGRKIGLKELHYGSVTTPAAESIAVEGSEIMSLPLESVTEFSNAIAAAPAGKLTIELVGSKGSVKVNLTAAQADGYRLSWQYAQLAQALNMANIRREKYERQLVELRNRLVE